MIHSIPKHIKCLLSVDQETKLWIGHCLDFDLKTSGKSQQSVWVNLKSVVKLHIEHSFANAPERMNAHRAPMADWDCFMNLSPRDGLRDKIELDLIPAHVNTEDDIWINGVEIGCLETTHVQSVN